MIQLVYSPKWFYGKDIIIDLVSIVILVLIAFFSLKYYKMDKKRKGHLTLGVSFLMLAVSFVFKILTNFTIYYNVLETRQFGFITFTREIMKSNDALFIVGFLFFRLLMLIGLYLLYNLYQKNSRPTSFLIIFLIVISAYFSRSSYFIFHITALIMLILITIHFIRLYKKNKHLSSKMLMISFMVIALSNILFIFVSVNPIIYVIAELIQLLGYIGLLVTFIMVLTNGKKKQT